MPLSKRRLNILAKERKQEFEPIREFDNGTGHPVVLMRISHREDMKWGNIPWRRLMCCCDLAWKWEKSGMPPKRTMIMTGGINECAQKKHARKIIRDEAQKKYEHDWANMTLADRAYDIWKKSQAGEYFGEYDIGKFYVQDIEALLGTTPEVIHIDFGGGRNVKGELMSPPHAETPSFYSRTILSVVAELRERKLLDLYGMILVPYRERFRFPDQLHYSFAHWIEESLGWLNGGAGDGFLHGLYRKISRETGWKSCEDVFGKANTPKLTDAWKKHVEKWLGLLDPRLVSSDTTDKSAILRKLPVEMWVKWLNAISAEIEGVTEG